MIKSLCEVHCYDCHFGLAPVRTEEEAIKAWNTRKPAEPIVEEIIGTIERELDKATTNADYICEDGTIIGTDVGYVYEWIEEYKDVLRRKYCSREKIEVSNDGDNRS